MAVVRCRERGTTLGYVVKLMFTCVSEAVRLADEIACPISFKRRVGLVDLTMTVRGEV
jgi:hypothetical protein